MSVAEIPLCPNAASTVHYIEKLGRERERGGGGGEREGGREGGRQTVSRRREYTIKKKTYKYQWPAGMLPMEMEYVRC